MEEIISKIDRLEYFTYEESFELVINCSKLLVSGSEADEFEARRIVIHILDSWEKVCKDTYPMWADIIEAIGFYPYIQKNSNDLVLESFSDLIRQKHYMSNNLQNTYLHKEQKKLLEYILQGKNVIASAPTSFGKSLLIEELVASNKYKNIVIIQPTLALLDETRLKLRKYSNQYKIIVRTSQPASIKKGNLFLLTAERVMEYGLLPHIDYLIIDEFYKLSLKRSDDRADTLNNAFLKIVGNFNSKFYLLGPNIDGISPGFAEKYNAIFYKSNFSLVDCNVIDLHKKINWVSSEIQNDKQKVSILCTLLETLQKEQTLIYCSSPSRARRFAKAYFDYLVDKKLVPTTRVPLIEWISKNISSNWSLAKELQYGIAIHDGSLQKHIGSSIIRYFNKGLLNCIFCTSTIIEGVNTSAKNVVLLDGKKGGRDIDFFDYSNIKGRSGRLMEHYIGKIYNFSIPPSKEEIIIDIPFYEQDSEVITDEILINIPSGEIKDTTLERYNELYKIQHELLDIIKRNGVSIKGQMNIFYALEKDIKTQQYQNIAWTKLPNWDKMYYILGLAENNLFDFNSHHGVMSLKQLVLYLNKYRMNKNIMDIVNDIYKNKVDKVKVLTQERKQNYYDKAVEEAFHIYRHWFQFTIPKAFHVIDSIQRLVCEKHAKRAGSYSYFVQQLENDFIRENLSILVEFGIPASTIRLLESKIPENLIEDEVIEFIKLNKNNLASNLIEYEREKLDQCL